MKTLLSLTITLLYTFNIIVILVQNKPAISECVEKYIESAEPAWKLDRKENVPNGILFQWKLEKQHTDLSVVTLPSSAEAKINLHKTMMKVTVPPKSEIKGLGDEAFLYQMEGSNGCMLLLRKEEICVQVTASDCAVARKFAGHIINLANTR